MRRPFENAPPRQHLTPRSIDLGEIFSAVTSEIGNVLSNGASPTIMTTTTVTVGTTIVQTVTVHATPDTSRTHSTTCSGLCVSHSTSSSRAGVTDHQHTSLPPIVTESTSLRSPTASPTSGINEPVTTRPAKASPTVSSSNAPNKEAIVGGLAGAIAALIVIGILICLCLRRRRSRDEESGPISEKGLRPVIAQKWSQFTARTHLTAPPVPSRSSTPDFDGGPIRVSLDHWPRPFAHGESLRESMGPGRLRVMNPDQSRPTTPLPRRSSESYGGFLRQQRSALAAALLRPSRSRGNSSAGSVYRVPQVPAIPVDPASSTECVARNAPTPSFRSYSSMSTAQVVEQRPPEDPFLTPPSERDEPSPEPRPQRPNIAPLQTAAGAASRTLSHIGRVLDPFRSKTHTAESVISHPRHSISTFSSAGDPFKLDRPSIHENSGRTAGENERQPVPQLRLYEGT